MDRNPIPESRRRRAEAIIRWIDIVAYLAVLTGGIYALAFTPDSVTTELRGFEWLIGVWASLLLVGGGLGALGRITRFWVLEVPAGPAGMFGVAIYVVILGSTALESVTAAVATVLVLAAFLGLLRRYVELQIFGTDPSHQDLTDRLADALRRRTQNVAPRHE
ncbi:hypothetical protein [Rathayibacter sp. VKM Ac-2630]|uniref:hypothetical protein n=1 Tax=Rathayibacter sp. VKM Ac-2630 TaxID=1938617 RepID=UPI000981E402|nr:hypothetical protein [Rathayibacter sp. VKM Ac-2630]OOB90281.1 hypothetical protein B0T42_12325 [Rathayibacter sp. VKM Ac-2630]